MRQLLPNTTAARINILERILIAISCSSVSLGGQAMKTCLFTTLTSAVPILLVPGVHRNCLDNFATASNRLEQPDFDHQ
jgi:hypothetical protein